MGRTERILELEAALHAGKQVMDAPSWARSLGVDLRTFQRYLRYLRQVRKLPIYYDPCLKGYRLSAVSSGVKLTSYSRGLKELDLLRLTQAVRLEPGLSAAQLAKKMNYSLGTFYRKRRALQQMGIAIFNLDGYRLAQEVRLKNANFKAEEYVLLCLGARLLAEHLIDKGGACVGRILDKLYRAAVAESAGG